MVKTLDVPGDSKKKMLNTPIVMQRETPTRFLALDLGRFVMMYPSGLGTNHIEKIRRSMNVNPFDLTLFLSGILIAIVSSVFPP